VGTAIKNIRRRLYLKKFKPFTLVIIIFHFILLVNWIFFVWQTSLRFCGIEKWAIIPGWNGSFFFIYLSFALIYFSEKDIKKESRATKIISRVISYPLSIFFLILSFAIFGNSYLDTFVDKPIIKYIQVKERKGVYHSSDDIYIFGDENSYKAI
jgi:hypothetical protein